MHIAFLTPEYPHSYLNPSGGLGTSIKNLVTQLIQNGIKVSVVVVGQKKDMVFEENGIDFHILRQKKYPAFGFYLYRKVIERYINKLIETEKIDLIEAPDWTGLTAYMRLKAPLVIRFNGSDAYFCKLDGRKQKRKNFLFEKAALEGATELLSVSEFTARETKKIFKLKKEITVIPNSVDTTAFVPHPEKEQQGRVLYFGTIIRKKGVLELPPIFKRVKEHHKNAKFVFAGKDVIDVETGKSTIALLKESFTPEVLQSVEFLEEILYSAIREEIAKASVIVLPSFAEALPMTWLEAMAMEKALVTSNIGWAKEVMVDGETGYTVHPMEHEAYSNKIVTLLNDPHLRSKMGKQAREHVTTHFSSEVVTKMNIKDYQECINKKNAK